MKKTTPLIEAFGYLRVSGRGQLAGDGFPRQREAIQRYADAHGIKIARWPRRSARMTHFCSDRVDPPEAPRLRPQAEDREGDIIPAEGGLLGQVS
jgi:hypothetical protein